jgi:hypothetical protein
MDQKNTNPDGPAAAGKKINCFHPEPQSWVRGQVAEIDRLNGLPVKPVPWLRRILFLSVVGFVLFSILGGIGVLAKISGRETGYLLAICFCLAIFFFMGAFVAVWLCRCPTCNAKLKKHWGMCCEWAPGKKSDRLLLECSFCRVMWDAGYYGGGSTGIG